MASLQIATAGTYVSEGVYGNPFSAVSGAVATSIWSDVSDSVHTGFPGWPGSSSWGATISPNSATGTSTDIELERIAGTGHWFWVGGPYPADDTIYFGGFASSRNVGGTLAAEEVAPISNLTEVIFQIQLGEADGEDFSSSAAPTLTYTTSSGTFTATLTSGDATNPDDSFINGTYSNGEYDVDETVTLNEYEFTWDLSTVSETILSFKVEWNQAMHSQLYGFQVDQKD